jgi:hypothetical protein
MKFQWQYEWTEANRKEFKVYTHGIVSIDKIIEEYILYNNRGLFNTPQFRNWKIKVIRDEI